MLMQLFECAVHRNRGEIGFDIFRAFFDIICRLPNHPHYNRVLSRQSIALQSVLTEAEADLFLANWSMQSKYALLDAIFHDKNHF